MANFLTILRILLAFGTLALLFTGSPSWYFSAFWLTFFVIILDGLDGYVARARHEETKLGSVLDILGDRIVENAYWVTFAALGWIGAWLPIVVLSRGIITDGIRSLAFAEGYTAFGDKTMMTNPIGKFITASRFARAAYGGAKAIAFVMMIIAHVPNMYMYKPMSIGQFIWYSQHQGLLITIANVFAYIAVTFCVLRGIPVILESKRFFTQEKQENEQ
ncbi:MAG: CDP-alcohol phosphatidyltransferase family protein [Candidatus Gastranaerophilales bacterium]|nr:CDP-alcohol phosphatidyltransferase family protein [Candidatus Gastranaerophilales bacterium]